VKDGKVFMRDSKGISKEITQQFITAMLQFLTEQQTISIFRFASAEFKVTVEDITGKAGQYEGEG
jgi:hypothetical protein